MTISVVIVDDQAMVRQGFGALLDAQPDISVIGDAEDGAQGVREVSRLSPDVVLMDVRMPEVNGLEAASTILSMPSPSRPHVVMLTTFDVDDYVYEALRLGASGFLLKDAPAEELARAVRVVAQGDQLLAPSITRRLIAEATLRRGSVPRRSALLDDLTGRELEVLELVARGLANVEIADRLYLAEQTVKTHVSRVFAKLHLRDRAQAVVFAYEHGVVAPGA